MSNRRLLRLPLYGAVAILIGCTPGAASHPPDTTGSMVPDSSGGVALNRSAAPGEPDRWITPGSRPGIGGCPLFPQDHAYHASIRALEVVERSSRMIAATGDGDLSLRGGFGAGVWQGSRAGIPVNAVDGRSARRVDVMVANDYGRTGAHLGVPLATDPRFEGWPGKAWDAHLVTVDTSTCESRELINVRDPSDDILGIGGGRWYADAAATFDLTTNATDGHGVTAGNSSLLTGLVRFDEVASGNIQHVLAAGLPEISRAERVWPAMGSDGRSDDPNAMPMGSWLRLRSDADLSRLGPQARVIAAALRMHGAIVSDTGPGFTLRGEPDVRWDDRDVDTLESLSLDDFEVVDASPMMVSPDSYQIRGGA